MRCGRRRSAQDAVGGLDHALLAWPANERGATAVAVREMSDSDWKAALDFAARAAAVTVSRLGMDPPHRTDLGT